MKITRNMVRILSAYSIAFTRATTKGRIIDLNIGFASEIHHLLYSGAITLEQADSMMDYFSSISEEEEYRIENNK